MAFGPLGMGVAEVVTMIGLFAVANKTHALLSLAADEHLESADTSSMSSDSNENRT
ncbi:hypothetical protein [Legionella sp.]|uniref:hypothetical protein n=1 Tax=Legionella sp. TaxID=459 RepID=UPI003220211A